MAPVAGLTPAVPSSLTRKHLPTSFLTGHYPDCRLHYYDANFWQATCCLDRQRWVIFVDGVGCLGIHLGPGRLSRM